MTARLGKTRRETGDQRKVRPRVLVLSAFAPELADLARLLAGADTPRAVRARVVCRPAGIGLPDAAVGATRALSDVGPTEVLFIGTGGSYGAAPAIGSVAVARGVSLASAARARGQGYLPGPLVAHCVPNTEMRRRLLQAAVRAHSRAEAAHLATPLAITTAPALGRAHARTTGAAVENLEAFAVARAADAAGVPFGAVVGISNRVGPRAHEQWRRHQDAAMRAVAALVFDYLLARFKAPSR